VEKQFVPFVLESRKKVIAQFNLKCKPEDLRAVQAQDGERASIQASLKATGVSSRILTSASKVKDTVNAAFEHESFMAETVEMAVTDICGQEECIAQEPLHTDILLKNFLLGKFGAKCSGVQQWLDLCSYFINGKQFIRYQYPREVDDKQIWSESNPFYAELCCLRNMLRKGTQANPKTEAKGIFLPPEQAKKFAIAISLCIRSAESYATPEQLIKGYQRGFVQHVLQKDYRPVFEGLDLVWPARSDEEQARLLAAVPLCIDAMAKHKGLIPERVFTEEYVFVFC
jgi:hypothetical protein